MINISVIEDEKWMRDIIVEYLSVARTKFQEVKYQTYESFFRSWRFWRYFGIGY